jgi:two-component system, NtrC family, sensor kinase
MKTLVLGGGPAAVAAFEALTAFGHSPELSSDCGPLGAGRKDLIVLATPGDRLVACCQELRESFDPAVLLVIIDREGTVDPEALIDAGASDLMGWPEQQGLLRARLRSAAQRAERIIAERDRAERFRLLFNNELDAISIFDLGIERFLDVNEAWTALYGYTREEAVGLMGPRDVSADPDDTQRSILRLEKEGGCKVVRWHRARSGKVFPVEIYAGSYALGERRVVVSMIRDITDRIRLESQLRQADRLVSVGTLAAGVAHEINNPLSFVVGNLEFLFAALQRAELGAPADPAALREAVDEAREGARRVREVVKDLKTFSRAEDGVAGPVEVSSALDVALRMLGNELRHRAVVERAYASAPRAQVNEARLGQVFVNLLANAVQALPDRPCEQNRVRVSVRPGGQGEVVAEISDNGQGIPKDIRHRIFDPFFSTKQVGEGMGLGLSICQGIVAGFAGRLEVESEPGCGSTFRLILPAAPFDQPQPEPPPDDPASVDSRPLRLLLIDDERNLGLVLTRALQPAVELEFVTEAGQGLQKIRDGQRFDAVVCDLMMPSMSGMEFYAELERLDQALARRTGFITGGTFTPPARDFAGRMQGRIIEKPFLAEDLRQLAEALAGRPCRPPPGAHHLSKR